MLLLVVSECGLNFAPNKKKTKSFPSWDAWLLRLFVVSCWCVKTMPGKDRRGKRRSPPSSHLLHKETCSSKAPNGKLQKINLVLSSFIEHRRKTTLKHIWLPIMCKHLLRDMRVWRRRTSYWAAKSSCCGKLESCGTWGSSTFRLTYGCYDRILQIWLRYLKNALKLQRHHRGPMLNFATDTEKKTSRKCEGRRTSCSVSCLAKTRTFD